MENFEQQVEEYTKSLKEEIDNLINEMYKKTYVPKFQPYEIDYSIKGLNFRKENPSKYFMSGIHVVDPNKTYVLNSTESLSKEDLEDLKYDLIENNLIKVSRYTLFKHWLLKKWYTIKFIFYIMRIK